MADSIHYQCCQQVQAAIQGLALPLPAGGTLPSGRVYLRKVLTDRDVTLPAVIVFLPPMAEAALGGTNERDDWGYPVGVAIVSPSNADYGLDTDDEEYLRWRELIRKAFHEKRGITTPAEVYRTLWEPAPVIDYGAWEAQNLWVQGGVIRCVTREARA